MDIGSIINQNTNEVNVEMLELPTSMQEHLSGNTDNGNAENAQSTNESGENTTKLSLEQLSGMIIMGYNAISCMVYRRIEPAFDASLSNEEIQAINGPLKAVLQEYNVEMTPVTALIITVVGINVGKIMQLTMLRKELALQANQESEVKNGIA